MTMNGGAPLSPNRGRRTDASPTHPTGPAQGMSEHRSAADTALMARTSGSMLPPPLNTWAHTCRGRWGGQVPGDGWIYRTTAEPSLHLWVRPFC